ncbi:transcriptional regulator [Haloferax marisrubri]|uniref:AbrB/MazE/SpoVT family DNA-binding domain-containing protein n=1 Tax=Haloferax marisrubri TaxID=1544719 RepID=A0A2P4NR30_9EURY|nr:transcriptional regulator [Haloferax marisrubri]POG55538.1 AbrB/MazE/SpoVT family DNA-binding domain-containing protein [Haloferax marisrubri]
MSNVELCITIPSRPREQFDLERERNLMIVPTDFGLVLMKIGLPPVTEFQGRVEKRANERECSMDEINQLVHDARTDN